MSASVTADQKPAVSGARKIIFRIVFLLVIATAIFFGVRMWLESQQFASTDDAFIDGNIDQISAQVSGRVVKLMVSDNQMVTQDQVLALLDKRDYQIKLDQALAQQAQAQAQLAQAQAVAAQHRAGVAQAAANVLVAQADFTQAEQDANRFRAIDPKAVTRQQIDNALSTERAAKARLSANEFAKTAMEAQLAGDEAEIANMQAQLVGAEVAVRNAQLQMSYTEIRAPEAGRVTKRSVDLGNYVTPGQILLNLVPPNVWVTANYKESQLAGIKVGQKAHIRVDAIPDHVFEGHVDSFQSGSGAVFSALPAENATGNYVKVVQRIPVKILLDEPADPRLLLGLSVVPKVELH